MAYGLSQTVAPTAEPVSRAEAKAHVRQDSTADDDQLDGLIKAARHYCERWTGRAFVTSTWALTLDCLPCGGDALRLPKSPAIAVSSITYTDTAGATQTLSSTLYQVDVTTEPARIIPAYGQVWPTTRSQLGAVTVTFTAGYGAASAVPQPIKQAMLLLIGSWYENREAVIKGTIVAELPMAVEA